MTPVTGLPPELSTNGSRSPEGGFAVSLRSCDRAVIVTTTAGQRAPSQGRIFLFVLFLQGAAVDPARTRRIELGAGTGAPVAWNAVLPDGRILVAAGDNSGFLESGPMANHGLAIIDDTSVPPEFTLLPNPPLPGSALFGGLAVDPSGDSVYYVFSNGAFTGPASARLYRYNLATGQSCPVYTWIGQFALGIRGDDDGTVYVSSTDPTAAAGVTHFMHAVHPDGCNSASVTTVRSSLPLQASGFDLARASAQFAATSATFLGISGPQDNALSLVDRTTGGTTIIAQAPAGGWGLIGAQAVAVNNAIDSYGPSSDGQNRYWFENFPNPGGPPSIGNGGFSLTVAATATAPLPLLSILVLSSGRARTPFAGVEILVDLASIVLQTSTVGQSVPLPIPNAPTLRGRVLTAQSLHLETNNRFAASRGLTLTLQ